MVVIMFIQLRTDSDREFWRRDVQRDTYQHNGLADNHRGDINCIMDRGISEDDQEIIRRDGNNPVSTKF